MDAAAEVEKWDADADPGDSVIGINYEYFDNKIKFLPSIKEVLMPFGDRTGPLGQGPMTGRGAGYCAGYETPGYANPGGFGFGFGRGRGRGFGRGYGRGFYGRGMAPRWGWNVPPAAPTAPTSKQELHMLKKIGRAHV